MHLGLRDDASDLLGERSSVGIAQDDPLGACLGGGLNGRERVLGIGLEAIEEVLRIVDHCGALREIGHALADHVEVFLQGYAEDFRGVKVPGLAHHGDHGCLRGHEGGQSRVVRGLDPAAACHAEGSQATVTERQTFRSLKEHGIFFIRERVPTLDHIDSDLGQSRCDVELVLER